MCVIMYIMYIRVITPGHTGTACTLLQAHAYVIHVEASTTTELKVIIDICQFSSYHMSLIATLFTICALTYQ